MQLYTILILFLLCALNMWIIVEVSSYFQQINKDDITFPTTIETLKQRGEIANHE